MVVMASKMVCGKDKDKGRGFGGCQEQEMMMWPLVLEVFRCAELAGASVKY